MAYSKTTFTGITRTNSYFQLREWLIENAAGLFDELQHDDATNSIKGRIDGHAVIDFWPSAMSYAFDTSLLNGQGRTGFGGTSTNTEQMAECAIKTDYGIAIQYSKNTRPTLFLSRAGGTLQIAFRANNTSITTSPIYYFSAFVDESDYRRSVPDVVSINDSTRMLVRKTQFAPLVSGAADIESSGLFIMPQAQIRTTDLHEITDGTDSWISNGFFALKV